MCITPVRVLLRRFARTCRTSRLAETPPFLRSLMDTELYSIGAFFCDEHPELVDEVVRVSGEIERAGLRGLRRGRRAAGRGGVRDAPHGPRRPVLQGRRRRMSPWVPARSARARRDRGGIRDRRDLGRRGRAPGGRDRGPARGPGADRRDPPGRRRGSDRRTPRSRSTCSPTSARCPRPTSSTRSSIPLIKEYVRTGRAQINLRHFSFGRTAVTEAAIAADAAGAQGHQWQYAELVMRNLELADEDGVDEEFLNEIAEVTPGLEQGGVGRRVRRGARAPGGGPGLRERGRRRRRAGVRAEAAGRSRRSSSPGPAARRRSTRRPRSTRSRLAIERVEVPPRLAIGLGARRPEWLIDRAGRS